MSVRRKILIVEDEKSLNQAYQTILKKGGYDTESALDGEEALIKAEEFLPDLILLDLRMPRMSGLEFLKKFDLKKRDSKIKVIVFSNLDTDKDIDEAYELGARRYVLKAWASPRELLSLVDETIHEVSKHD